MPDLARLQVRTEDNIEYPWGDVGHGGSGVSLPVSVEGTVTTSDPALTSFGTAQATVTTAGTRVQLATNTCKSMTIKAKSTNTGLIYVGNVAVTSANGFILSPGDSLSMDISNTNLVYIDSSVSAEGVSFLYAN